MAKKLREIVEMKKRPYGTKLLKFDSMSAFVAHHMDNTKMTHDELSKKFKKEYGKDIHAKHFEKLVTKHS